MKKKILPLICIILFIILVMIIFFIKLFDKNIKLESINLINYDDSKMEATIEINIEENILFANNFKCTIKNDNNSISVNGKNNKCTLVIPIEQNYNKIEITNYNKKHNYNLSDYIENKLDFKFTKDSVYLLKDEEQKIEYTGKYVITNDEKEFYSEDENIVKIVDNKIVGINNGTTRIHDKDGFCSLEVTVTDLITKPIINKNKEYIPCHRYSEEESELLDKLLKNEVNNAGYQTRAGVVAAARFLLLEFRYKLPYFYENGRLSGTGTSIADGEGRYYHEGLYLSESKFSGLKKSYSGPAIWGCPLRNWQDDKYFGYRSGELRPNGLDCSGFVSWAIRNGGFDPGDIGAGETEMGYELTDLGELVYITDEIAMSKDIIKAGDLLNYYGHIALIIGIDDDHYYVAESLPDFGGVDLRIYTRKQLDPEFRYVILMDKYYKNQGNYTAYWE